MRVRRSVPLLLLACLTLAACTQPTTNPGPQPGGDPGAPEPYVMKGRVTDRFGAPLEGVEVFADNTVYYNTNLFDVTDADGRYRIDLGGIVPSSWHGGAYVETTYLGTRYRLSLAPDDDAVFAGVDGAVRDFTWRLSGETPEGGTYGALVYVYAYLDIEDADYDAVELTFAPDGPLIDGGAGETLTRAVEGGAIDDVPLGRYTVTARYTEPGRERTLAVRARDAGEYGPSATLRFEDVPLYGVLGEIEVR